MAVRLDHLVIIAPTLAEGLAHVRETLGVEVPPGGKHPLMGTHNHVMRLGDDVFFEIIAVDPDAPDPGRKRWFGLSDAAKIRQRWDAGHRLNAWVAATDDLAGALRQHGDLFGNATRQTRGAMFWDFAVRPDGELTLDGALPCLIEWPDHRNPARNMAGLGCRVRSFTITHPDAKRAQSVMADLRFEGGVSWRDGPSIRLEAEIETPAGLRRL